MSEGLWIYCLVEAGCEASGPCKVGIATNLEKRLSSLQGGNHRPLIIAWSVLAPNREMALQTEGFVLGRFRPDIYRIDGRTLLRSEWIEATPQAARDVVSFCLRALTGEEE